MSLAIAEGDAIHGETYLKVADFPGPVEATRHYLAGRNQQPARAVFAVAGPVTGADAFELTNHPWRFSIAATRQALGLAWLKLINDFHAVALAPRMESFTQQDMNLKVGLRESHAALEALFANG